MQGDTKTVTRSRVSSDLFILPLQKLSAQFSQRASSLVGPAGEQPGAAGEPRDGAGAAAQVQNPTVAVHVSMLSTEQNQHCVAKSHCCPQAHP